MFTCFRLTKAHNKTEYLLQSIRLNHGNHSASSLANVVSICLAFMCLYVFECVSFCVGIIVDNKEIVVCLPSHLAHVVRHNFFFCCVERNVRDRLAKEIENDNNNNNNEIAHDEPAHNRKPYEKEVVHDLSWFYLSAHMARRSQIIIIIVFTSKTESQIDMARIKIQSTFCFCFSRFLFNIFYFDLTPAVDVSA